MTTRAASTLTTNASGPAATPGPRGEPGKVPSGELPVLTPPPWWMRCAPYAAALWSGAYLILGLLWLGGRGSYPWHLKTKDTPIINVLGGIDQQLVAWMVIGTSVAGLGLTATMVALSRRPGRAPGLLRRTALFAGLVGIVLALVVPDYRILMAVGYLPMLIAMSIAGGPPSSTGMNTADLWASAFAWPVDNLIILTLGGVAFLASALGLWRLASYACQRCGRGDHVSRWTEPANVVRWGRWATGAAAAIPVGYATTRISFMLGFPLGVNQKVLDQLGELRYVGGTLGVLAVGGAILTIGLVRPWGEVWPRWIPRLRGRRVPVGVAVVPASIVSVIVISAGLMFVRIRFSGVLFILFPGEASDFGAWVPEMFWPLWGLSLAAATYAYWLRRRGRCATCGQGSTS